MKKLTRRSFLTLLAAAATVLPLATQNASAQPGGDFFFRDGDRAMLLGDSITQQFMYSTLVESYVYSRFPNWKITFRNTGWGGDTMALRTRGGQENGFKRDLAPLAPTAVTIDFGMNDARAGDAGYEPYVTNTRSLVDRFNAIGTRIALVAPSSEEKYEAGQPAGSKYNVMLRKYTEGLKGVAAEKNVLFVDQLNPMIATIEAGRESGVLAKAEGGPRLINDAVHPGWSGQLIMAAYILKGLKAPSLVSSVEIDAATGKVNAEKAKVTDVKTGETLTFTRLDESIPWPMPLKETELALKIPGFTPLDDLSNYALKVTSLPRANYKVALDGIELGTFSKEQLAGGVNLSRQAAGIMPEAGDLLKTINTKNQVFFHRWRNVQLFQKPDWLPADVINAAMTKELAKQDATLAELDAKLKAPKTQAHVWTLTPAA